ncbi:MAG: cytochrome o ubiquinol oxidase subunit III CyoC [uncultured bacterium]|nr:MAG: cytochrome o ubiquinol oxidase subunit III CyoC [uncultured bacterium]
MHNPHHDHDATDVFGFWLYIMTDCILFACLFAVFLVMHSGIAGPILKNYLDLKNVLFETFLLLASNFTFCLALLNLNKEKFLKVQGWLVITLLLGAGFIAMELAEFTTLAADGYRWDVSGQASSFFTLVGTHGLHVTIGLCWILLMMLQLPLIKLEAMKRRMTYLGLFWNFLDIVWIFVFTIVYLMGSL